jgi:hypothetical protein
MLTWHPFPVDDDPTAPRLLSDVEQHTDAARPVVLIYDSVTGWQGFYGADDHQPVTLNAETLARVEENYDMVIGTLARVVAGRPFHEGNGHASAPA